MRIQHRFLPSLRSGLLLVAGGLTALNAHAQSTDTWVGGTGNNFGTVANWTCSAGSGPVATGDSLVFDTVGSTTPNNDLAGLSCPGITYNASGLGFILGGNPFTLGTAGTIITVNRTSTQIINNNITLGNVAQTISLASGNLTLDGAVSGGGNTWTIVGGQSLMLSSANTYSGTTLVSAGTVTVGNATAFGASRVNLANGPATIDNVSAWRRLDSGLDHHGRGADLCELDLKRRGFASGILPKFKFVGLLDLERHHPQHRLNG